jgi:hypothetical protein
MAFEWAKKASCRNHHPKPQKTMRDMIKQGMNLGLQAV